MSTIRIAHRKGYVVVGNDIAQHCEMSYMARGLLTYLLSLPDNASIRSEDLVQADHKPGEGRAAVRRCLAEIEAAGYLARERRQDERGRWTTISTLFDHPQPKYYPQAKTPGRTEDQNPNIGNAKDKIPGHTEDQEPDAGQPDAGPPTVGGLVAKNKIPLLTNTFPPTPNSTTRALAAPHLPQGGDPPATPPSSNRRRPKSTRATGTNPRALAQEAEEAATREAAIEAARQYGSRMGGLDLADIPAVFRAQLEAELDRGMSRLDSEKIQTAVDAYEQAYASNTNRAEDRVSQIDLTASPSTSEPAFKSGPSPAATIRAAYPNLFPSGTRGGA